MRKLLIGWTVVLVGAALVLTTGACGSGDGGTMLTPTVSVLQAGNYCFLLFTGDVTGPDATTFWGDATSDGSSSVDLPAVMENDNGTVAAMPAASALFTMSAGNAMNLFVSGLAFGGGLATDGSMAALATINSTNPAVAILGSKGSGFGNTSLFGDYHLCAFFFNAGGPSDITWWGGTATFDGAGTCTGWSAGINSNGAVAAPAAPIAFGTYAVLGDGTMTWNTGVPGLNLSGGLFAGGELGILTGSTMNGINIQMILFLVRKGTGLGPSTFSGDYFLIALGASNAPPPRWQSIVGSGTADGAGNFNLGGLTTVNLDGMINVLPGGATQSYTITNDGTLDVLSGELLGGISPSGRFAVGAGTSSAAGTPLLFFYFR